MKAKNSDLISAMFRDILLTLHNEYTQWSREYLRSDGTKKHDFYDIYVSAHRQIDERELEGVFKSESVDFTEQGGFLYLKPVQKEDGSFPYCH